jgi:hypothetical protein
MASQYRHRRTSDPTRAFPATIEPGEIAVNTANRQIAVGDANASTTGVPEPLLPVRYFDARAQYAAGDFVWQASALYRAKAAILPGAFNAANWDVYSSDATIKAYADTGDANVTTAFQAADATLTTNANSRVAKAGDSMTGPLVLPAAPTADQQAANKKYVDDAITAATGGGGATAADIANVPAGNIAATDVQSALNELDNEKVPSSGNPGFVNTPTAPPPPANDNSTKMINSQWFAGQASAANPAMDGAVAPGTSLTFARGDHVHPTDTSRAPVNSPAFGGNPTAPTPAVNDNSNSLATTAFVLAQPVTNIANGIVSFIKMAASAIASSADFLSNTANKILTADRVWAAAVPVANNNTAFAPDFNAAIDYVWTLTGVGCTLSNPTNAKPGQKGVIYLVQNSTGNCTVTGWGTNLKFPAGVKPVLSTAANAVDLLSYAVKSATEIECVFVADMR